MRRSKNKGRPLTRINQSVPQKIQSVEELELAISQQALSRVENSAPPDPEPVPAVTLTQEDVQTLINSAVEERVKALQAEYTTALEQSQNQVAEANKKLAEADEKVAKADSIIKAMSVMGNPIPVGSIEDRQSRPTANFNTHIGTKADDPTGAAREMLERLYTGQKINKETELGSVVNAFDYNRAEMRKFLSENNAHIISDMESYAKQNGLLKGHRTTNAATTAADIPGAFLDMLSAMMRETHKPGLTFWQFCPQIINYGKNLGDTIQIPRAPYLPTVTDPNQRLLSGTDSFLGIDPGTDTVSTSVVKTQILEWGRGSDSTNRPLGFGTFIEQYSMIQLLQLVQSRLVYDYDNWYNLKVRTLWNTSAALYNDGAVVASNSSGMGTGDDGTLSRNYLINLYAYLFANQVMPFPDGCYGLWVAPQIWATFQQSLERMYNPPTVAQVTELTNFFNPSVISPGEVNRVSGYQGKYYNFHFFTGNDYASGAPGSPGVVTESINSGNRTVRKGFAFGADTIGCGVGMPMSIVQDEVRDFGRLNRFTWLAHMGFARLDVDPNHADGAASEQLRVYETRLLETAI